MNGDVVCTTVKRLILSKSLPEIMIIISSANNSNEDHSFYKNALVDLIEPKPLKKERMNFILNYFHNKFKK